MNTRARTTRRGGCGPTQESAPYLRGYTSLVTRSIELSLVISVRELCVSPYKHASRERLGRKCAADAGVGAVPTKMSSHISEFSKGCAFFFFFTRVGKRFGWEGAADAGIIAVPAGVT